MGFANRTSRPERRPIALAVTSSVVALLTTLGHGALWANGRQYRNYLQSRFEEVIGDVLERGLSRCIESARTHRARACALPLRASDTDDVPWESACRQEIKH